MSYFAHVSKYIRRILGLVICKGRRGGSFGSDAGIMVGKLYDLIPDGGVGGIFY